MNRARLWLGLLAWAVLVAGCTSSSTTVKPASGPQSSQTAASGIPSVVTTPTVEPTGPAPRVTVIDDVGSAPDGLAAGLGAIWVVNHPQDVLTRIDPNTNRAIQIPFSDQLCFRPWIGAGHVWIGGCSYGNTVDPGRTWVLDPATNKVVHVVPAYAEQAAFIGDSAWLQNQNYHAILRFDSRTYQQTGSIALAGLPVADGSNLWIVGQQTYTGEDLHFIAQIDPATDRVLRRIATPDIGTYGRTIAAYGALWEIGQGTGRLLRLDTTTGAVHIYQLPGQPSQPGDYEIYPLAAAGSIWVRFGNGQIDRFDPATERVSLISGGDKDSGGMLAYGFGSLWVANVTAETVWRESIP